MLLLFWSLFGTGQRTELRLDLASGSGFCDFTTLAECPQSCVFRKKDRGDGDLY